MAAVAYQVHSTAQQIGARIGWNPIDAATQPPTGTRERVLNLSALDLLTSSAFVGTRAGAWNGGNDPVPTSQT